MWSTRRPGVAMITPGSASQAVLLRLHREASDDHRPLHAGAATEEVEHLGDLLRQLPRRGQHQPQRARAVLSRSTIGITKAAVLPVPVAAPPMTSLPFSAGGMACCWMGVGRV